MSDPYLNEVIRTAIADELANNSKDAVGVHIPEPHITDEHVNERKRRIDDECELAGYKQALKRVHFESYYASMMSGAFDEAIPRLKTSRERLREARQGTTTVTPYMFITVNPKPDVEFKDLKKKVEKYVKRKFIKSYSYVYEQRGYEGRPPIGSGYHAHIMVSHTAFGGDFRRNTQNTFESLVADAENWHYLRIESNKTEDDIKKRVKYMHGDKNVKADKDKTKPLKQAMDTEWRSIMNLDIKYESPDFAYIFA